MAAVIGTVTEIVPLCVAVTKVGSDGGLGVVVVVGGPSGWPVS